MESRYNWNLICGDCKELTIKCKCRQDEVNHPRHYTSHPSGIECLDVAEYMNFNLGNAVKYIWRCELKDDPIQNLEKAIFYIQREIKRRQNATQSTKS